ncbi:MAG: D-alanyl-D-alanine carboxypeptidase/D-alanyl-D-alanine-endopeptidase, partial [Desulfobacterales bacterium]
MSPFKSYAKRFWVVFAVLALACTSSQTFLRPGDKAKSTAQLQQQIDTILRDSLLHQSRTGIKVVSLTTGKVWYAKDSHLLFHPASNMKLLTTATALRTLGPDFRFNTALAVETEAFSDSTIHGNLYLKGNADPTLTTRDLWWLVQKLKRLGVKKIENNLVCDESYLDDLYLGNGWMWDDVSSKYWPPIGALTVNRNCVTLTVSPGAKIGAPLHVQIEPQTNYVSIENFGVTVDSS